MKSPYAICKVYPELVQGSEFSPDVQIILKKPFGFLLFYTKTKFLKEKCGIQESKILSNIFGITHFVQLAHNIKQKSLHN